MNAKQQKKQYEQDKFVAQIIVDLKTQKQDVAALASDYDRLAVEALRLGENDAYVDELADASVEASEFCRQLDWLILKLRTSYTSSRAFGNIKRELPRLLNSCRNMVLEGKSFTNLSKDFSSVVNSISTVRDQFGDFRRSLSKCGDATYATVFGKEKKVASSDDRHEKLVVEKKKQLLYEVSKYSDENPSPVKVDDQVSIDAITKMLDEERTR